MSTDSQPSGLLPTDTFDLALKQLDGLPGTTRTRPSIVKSTDFYGNAATFIVETVRARDETSEETTPAFTTFVQRIDAGGSFRLVIPPEVTKTIDSQRTALADKARRKSAQQGAATRKAKGIVPVLGFLKNRGTGGRRKRAGRAS